MLRTAVHPGCSAGSALPAGRTAAETRSAPAAVIIGRFKATRRRRSAAAREARPARAAAISLPAEASRGTRRTEATPSAARRADARLKIRRTKAARGHGRAEAAKSRCARTAIAISAPSRIAGAREGVSASQAAGGAAPLVAPAIFTAVALAPIAIAARHVAHHVTEPLHAGAEVLGGRLSFAARLFLVIRLLVVGGCRCGPCQGQQERQIPEAGHVSNSIREVGEEVRPDREPAAHGGAMHPYNPSNPRNRPEFRGGDARPRRSRPLANSRHSIPIRASVRGANKRRGLGPAKRSAEQVHRSGCLC